LDNDNERMKKESPNHQLGEAVPAPRSHLPALDGLRGVAILMVLFWHFIVSAFPAPGGTPAGYFFKLFHHAYSGVDLFFVLSGFLITGILLDSVGKPGWLKRFWIRRTFRILPLYLLFLLLVMVLHALRGDFFGVPSSKWPYFLMLQNFQMAKVNSLGPWGITWSLAIEEQFYLIFPLIVYFTIARRWLPFLCLLAIGLSLALRLHGEYLYSFVLTPYRLDGLAAGALCAWLCRRPAIWQEILTRPWITFVLASTGMVLLVCITVRTQQRHPIDHTVFAYAYAAILLHVITRERGFIAILLSHPILRFMGMISYPLYLFHEPCSWVINLALVKQPKSIAECLLASALAAPLSILVAALLNRFVGDPFVRLGRMIANRQVPKTVCMVAPECKKSVE